MECMSSDRFIQEYELKLKREFELDGKEAQWAAGVSGPRFWGEEDASIILEGSGLEAEGSMRGRSLETSAACTPDSKYLAVSRGTRIMILDISTGELQADTVGHEYNISRLHFAQANGPSRSNGYILFAVGEAERNSGDELKIVVWRLDGAGRPIGNIVPPLQIEVMADKAFSAIHEDLTKDEDLTDEEARLIRNGLLEVLNVVDTKKRMKYVPTLGGSFPNFGTVPSSHDARRLLFLINDETTQHGMRPSDELPQVVVVNVSDLSVICRLKGHKDAIMWAGWSLDDQTIVTASWDQTFRIWDAQTGECRHLIGPTGGQNWSGELSPIGPHAVLSGGKVIVGFYDLQTGEKLAALDKERLQTDDWHRELHWSPAGDLVAIVSGRSVLLWDPFLDTVKNVIELEGNGTIMDSFTTFYGVQWVEGGNKLIVQGSDRTIWVWDVKRHCKWRFQHPKGIAVKDFNQSAYYVASENTIVSVDGDRTVRYWKL